MQKPKALQFYGSGKDGESHGKVDGHLNGYRAAYKGLYGIATNIMVLDCLYTHSIGYCIGHLE